MTGPRLGVVGASGRVGRRVVELAPTHGFSSVRAIARGAWVTLASEGFDVVVDFSAPEATRELIRVVERTGVALVSGTTGLSAADHHALDVASRAAAVFWEPNMSFGIHIFRELTKQAAARLGPSFDVEVVEVHHRNKADAPSGTAKKLVEALGNGEGLGAANVTHGRKGRPGPRPAGEIGVHAVRGGDVIGDHTVHFLGLGERIELTHRATDRDLFAHGALRAAAFLVGRAPGRYGMHDLFA